MATKVLVVAGPNRGATYFLEEGETTFGRSPESQIVLASTQVSKKHFSITVSGRKAELNDLGSSNGTFVNGILTKKKLLQSRDRVSCGPFVLEMLLPEAVVKPKADFSSQSGASDLGSIGAPTVEAGQFKLEAEEPKSLVGKYKKKFDDVFLPVLYDFYERNEFSNLLAAMFGVYAIVSLGFTVYPVLQHSREEVLRQAQQQAKYMVELIAKTNQQAIAEKKEGAVYVDMVDVEPYIKKAIVSDLEGRILAPGSNLNESYNDSPFLRYRDQVRKNNNLWGKSRVIRNADAEEMWAFIPIMVDTKQGLKAPAAIVTVVFDTSTIALDSGTIGTIYLEALFWSGLLGMVFLYLVYHVMHRPLHKLNDDMDRVLKGETETVEKKYRNEVIDQLIDTINSALGRIPRASGVNSSDAAAGDSERVIIDNMMRSVDFLCSKTKHPLMVLDPEMRVKQTNEAFEELTGIRGATGELIETVSRDESFPALLKELVSKSTEAGGDASEDYDFPSGTHKVQAVALSGMPGTVEAFLFLFEKAEE